jgi:hypothetical protein
VVVIGTDSPLLPPRVLREALRELRVCDAVLGPCPDGGYYLVGLRRLTRGLLRGVRWGRASAFRDTLRNLLAVGYSCSILEPCSDVDVPRDVRWLEGQLASSKASRRLAPSSWRFLKGFPTSPRRGVRGYANAGGAQSKTREIQPPPNTSSPA